MADIKPTRPELIKLNKGINLPFFFFRKEKVQVAQKEKDLIQQTVNLAECCYG